MKKTLKFFYELKLPIIMIALISLIYFFGKDVPVNIASIFLALSYTIKNIIVALLPIMIIVYVTSALMHLRKGALKFSILILVFIMCSNFISIWYSFEFFKMANLGFSSIESSANNTFELKPMWNFPELKIISNDTSLLLGFGLGIFFGFFEKNKLATHFNKARTVCNNFLTWVLLPCIPLFIAGFALKISIEGNLSSSLATYGKILFVFTFFQLLYCAFSFLVASSFSSREFLRLFKNIFPVSITGFATFSSAATMPITIAAARKNLDDPKIGEAFIPTTTNIHLLGTSIGKIVIIMSVFAIFGKSLPTEYEFLIFSIFFTMAQFAVIGVPGGTIFVQTPIIENYLGANPEMIAIITMLVLLFDPIDTSFNVTLNSTFAVIFEKIVKFFKLINGYHAIASNKNKL